MLQRNELKWILLWFGAIIAVSFSAVFGKIFIDKMPVYTFLAIWNLFLMLIIMSFYWLKNIVREMKNHSKTELSILIIVWLFLWIIVPLLYYTWLEKTFAINTILISRIEPIFAWIIGILRIWERFSWGKLFSMLIMFLGVSIVVTEWFSGKLSINYYDILIVLAALFWAIATNAIKKHLQKTEVEVTTFIISSMGAFFFIVLYPIITNTQHEVWKFLDMNTIVLLFLYSFVVLFLWNTLWVKALKKVQVNKLSLISLTYPIFGVLLSYMILWEKIASYHVYWLIIIILWLLLGFLHRKKFNLFHPSEKFHHVKL